MRSARPVRRALRGVLAALALGLCFYALPGGTAAEARPHCCWNGGWGWGWGGGPWGWYPPYAYNPYYYYPPPAYYPPPPPPVVVVQPQAAAPAQQSCKGGTWREQDGKTVAGTACLQADGTWRMTQ
jgi:hypothetical protein